ncbi:MAG: hypothetical protein RLZZ502_1214, partial [Pseudomonadota bacterium]
VVPWYGVRNYQARNYMRDDMRLGDGVLFYHSSCAEPGVVGLAKVSKLAYADATQFDSKSKYHDPKSTPDKPRWVHVEVAIERKTRLLSLAQLREHPGLGELIILKKGNRLSITPVNVEHWAIISKLLK